MQRRPGHWPWGEEAGRRVWVGGGDCCPAWPPGTCFPIQVQVADFLMMESQQIAQFLQ